MGFSIRSASYASLNTPRILPTSLPSRTGPHFSAIDARKLEKSAGLNVETVRFNPNASTTRSHVSLYSLKVRLDNSPEFSNLCFSVSLLGIGWQYPSFLAVPLHGDLAARPGPRRGRHVAVCRSQVPPSSRHRLIAQAFRLQLDPSVQSNKSCRVFFFLPLATVMRTQGEVFVRLRWLVELGLL